MKKGIKKVVFKYSKDSDTKGFKMASLDSFLTENNSTYRQVKYQYHQIDFFAILILTEGKVEHTVDFKTVHLKAGDSLIITKDQIHAFDTKSNYKGNLLVFSEEFLHKHITQSTLSKIPFLYNHNQKHLIFNNPENNKTLIDLLLSGISNNVNVKSNQIGALLSYFLLNLVSEESSDLITQNRYQEYFMNFKQLVEQDYQHRRNAKDYAITLNISYKHLNEVCKHMVNKTAKALIDDYVVLQAKRLLVISPHSVKEIAYKLGFGEPTNFRKYFIKHTGYSPNEFLKKMNLVSH
ncbi:MAG: AraC family transcriptional regulator [Marinifilaceae bacterium]|jgi:AraC-like DNA-binding protein/mannose-6-phosphate isomerase-like protein (cupin superfamily)|nr:AraC family transcriptional regulator [Marinifilaceae bacterium]